MAGWAVRPSSGSQSSSFHVSFMSLTELCPLSPGCAPASAARYRGDIQGTAWLPQHLRVLLDLLHDCKLTLPNHSSTFQSGASAAVQGGLSGNSSSIPARGKAPPAPAALPCPQRDTEQQTRDCSLYGFWSHLHTVLQSD